MPDLTGKTAMEAEEALSGLGLQSPRVTEAPQPGTDNGLIVRQSPGPRSTVSADDTISLTVVNNLGPLPDLTPVPPTPATNSEPQENPESAPSAAPEVPAQESSE
jgi:beta-lactam-binding protein with PASTA domain